jgi:transcriptional regulator with XRE-family HTH domain
MDRASLADFLRSRRAALPPLYWRTRNAGGLRREDVAEVAHISVDYYTRLEQRRGPRPSPEVALALSRALAMTADERDHLFMLMGHNPPVRANGVDEADVTLRRALQAIERNPALITSNLGHTLAQNPVALALFGDQARYRGLARSGYFRWFAIAEERARYPQDIHADQSQTYAASVRAAMDIEPDSAEAAEMVRVLHASSPEFASLWEKHQVHVCKHETTSLLHPSAGRLDFDCDVLFGDDRRQRLLVLHPRNGADLRKLVTAD